MQVGVKGYREIVVDKNMLASCVGSGLVDVFSTPMMIAFLEGTAADSVKEQLLDGDTTVGVHLDVRHMAATPEGMRVRFETELTAVEGKMLTFVVAAYDEKEQIGAGTHQRAIVNVAKFSARAHAKRTAAPSAG